MKNRIAYNLVTGEIVECRCSKSHFKAILHKTCEWDVAHGIRPRWVFRYPWG